MANKVPISTENLAYERLDLTRHYLTIDCDFTVYLVLNSSGAVPAEGTDICVLHTGSWQIDAWSLLTKKDFPNQAGFTAHLVWDKTLVKDGYNAPQAMESDIDTANSVSSLKGQPVNITGFSMPQGQTLPVSIWRNSLEVDNSNPVPSSLMISGSPAAPANPVPSSMQIGSQVVSQSNPVPSLMQVGGSQVSVSNPVPSSLQIGGVPVSNSNNVPVSLFSDGVIVSESNPLPVRLAPFELYMAVGAEARIHVLKSIAGQFKVVGAVTRYRIIPKRFMATTDSQIVSFYYDRFTHEVMGEVNSTKYLVSSLPVIVAFVDNETHLYTGFEFTLKGSKLYTEVTDVHNFEGMTGSSLKFWIAEV